MYWESRKDNNYYKYVIQWLNEIGHHASYMDVGTCDTPIIQSGSFDRRIAVDILKQPALEGVESIVGDFMILDLPYVSVVTCLQVLEHVFDPAAFAQKLLNTADKVLVSVPYEWPKGFCNEHIHDPIDMDKFYGWLGREPVNSIIINDNNHLRLVAQWDGLKSLRGIRKSRLKG